MEKKPEWVFSSALIWSCIWTAKRPFSVGFLPDLQALFRAFIWSFCSCDNCEYGVLLRLFWDIFCSLWISWQIVWGLSSLLWCSICMWSKCRTCFSSTNTICWGQTLVHGWNYKYAQKMGIWKHAVQKRRMKKRKDVWYLYTYGCWEVEGKDTDTRACFFLPVIKDELNYSECWWRSSLGLGAVAANKHCTLVVTVISGESMCELEVVAHHYLGIDSAGGVQ